MDNFKFNLIGAADTPFGGYISERDRTALSGRFLVKGSKNVYLKDSGTIAARPGLKRRGSADNTAAGIDSSFEWATSLGSVRALRICNGKLEVESDIVTSGTYVWYTLLSSLTKTRYNFDTWWDNTAKKDILIFCDGTDTLKTWTGAIGLIASTTSNTIVLTASAASLGFASSGTVIINGTEYTYSGVSSATLTGVGTDPTGEADGSVVLQKPDITTDADKPADAFLVDFIKVVNNQLYCGSDTSRLVYISKNTAYNNFTASSPRVPGDADILTLDEVPTGIGARDGKAHISTANAWYVVSFNQITVSTTLTEQTIVDKVPMAARKGALRHEFIDSVGNDIVYLSQDQQVHVYGTFRSINQPQFPSLSDDIKSELEDEDFTGGHLRAAGDFIYITAPNNGRVWLQETRTKTNSLGNIEKERIWHAPFIWNIARIAVISGVEYGHSNGNPQIFQLWGTLQWHDDAPTDTDGTPDALPYDWMMAFAYQGEKSKLSKFDMLYTEGYMSPGSDVRGALVYEYKGEAAVQALELNTEETGAEFYIGDVGIALGDASLGDNPLGDATSEEDLDQELLPKFRVINDLELVDAFEWQIRIYSTEIDSRCEVLVTGVNDELSETDPGFIRR